MIIFAKIHFKFASLKYFGALSLTRTCDKLSTTLRLQVCQDIVYVNHRANILQKTTRDKPLPYERRVDCIDLINSD